MAELTKLASAKKIAPGDFHEICRTLKKVKSLRLLFSPVLHDPLNPYDMLIVQIFSFHPLGVCFIFFEVL